MKKLYKVNYTASDGIITNHELLAENIVCARKLAEGFGQRLNEFADKDSRVNRYTISESK